MTKLAIKPVTDHKEYKEAVAKLEEFVNQKNFMQLSLNTINGELALLNAKQDETDFIAKASNLINGVSDAPLRDKASKLHANITILDKAIAAQREAIINIRRKLGVDIGNQLKPLHKEITARIANAIKELDKANKEEMALRDKADSAGYLNVALPTMTYLAAYDPNDLESPLAYYWIKSAEQYLAK